MKIRYVIIILVLSVAGGFAIGKRYSESSINSKDWENFGINTYFADTLSDVRWNLGALHLIRGEETNMTVKKLEAVVLVNLAAAEGMAKNPEGLYDQYLESYRELEDRWKSYQVTYKLNE